jgi:hypothetical protein
LDWSRRVEELDELAFIEEAVVAVIDGFELRLDAV